MKRLLAIVANQALYLCISMTTFIVAGHYIFKMGIEESIPIALVYIIGYITGYSKTKNENT